ncbi:MAG: MFS transporter [Candidatus Ranarchaeia archaeon]|jgi:MFS family permease
MADKTSNPKEKSNKQYLPYILLLTLVADIGTMIISPIQPEIAAALSVTSAEISLALSVYFLPSVILTPIFGAISDKYGRLPVLAPTMILFGISGFGIFFITDFGGFLLLRLFQGIINSGFIVFGAVLVGDLYEGQQLKSAMGSLTAAGGFGKVLGLNIGSFLVLLGWQIPFLIFTILIPIALLLVYGLRDIQVKRKKEPTYVEMPDGKVTKLRVRHFLTLGLFLVFVATFYQPFQNASAFLTYMPFLLTSIGVETALKGGFMTIMWFGTLTSGLIFGKISKRVNLKILLGVSYLVDAICLFLLGIVADQYSLAIVLFVYGLGFGMVGSSAGTFLLLLCPPDAKGTFVSFRQGIRSIGRSGGPATFAFLALTVPIYSSLTTIYWTIGALAAIACVVALVVPQRVLIPRSEQWRVVEKPISE